MKANELRVGNWVQDMMHFMGYFQVEGIQETLVKSPEWWLNYDDVAYIPLTEEWLVKFGFVKEIAGLSGEYDWRCGNVLLDNLMQFVWYEHAPLQYVHQLQNLYFALTGEELTIKEV